MVLGLSLRYVEPKLHERAREAFLEGDGSGFVYTASGNKLQLVVDNLRLLKERGIYEQSLLTAFTACRVNHHEWSEKWMNFLFSFAEPIKLRTAGDPLPGPGPFDLYRGVAGVGKLRRLRGYSWTSSLDTACWFAVRFGLPSPAVLEMTVSDAEVLAYSNGRDEQEFICKPREAVCLRMTPDEIAERARVRTESVRRANETRFAEFLAGTRSS